jgi:protein-S-isoprenylcysteine O-methyltransferase Ste14
VRRSFPFGADGRDGGCGGRTMILMAAVKVVYALGWAVFWLYWLAAAFTMKRGRVPWSREIGVRLVIVAVVIGIVRIGAFHHSGVRSDAWRASVGLLLFVVGLGGAVWARLHIGRNWGTPMTRKDDPELITSGPYRFIRHPIYSGILLAGVGTAVGLNWRWLIFVVIAGGYFIYSATVEERYMAERFPAEYDAYKHTTKMLVPFVF